jgi:hypothetical protein
MAFAPTAFGGAPFAPTAFGGAPFGGYSGTISGAGIPYAGQANSIGANTIIGTGAAAGVGTLLNARKTAVYSGGAGFPISSWPSPVINDETERIKLSQKFAKRHQRNGFDFDWQSNPPAGANTPNLQYMGASVKETRYLSGAAHQHNHGLIQDNRLTQNTMIQGAPIAQHPGYASTVAGAPYGFQFGSPFGAGYGIGSGFGNGFGNTFGNGFGNGLAPTAFGGYSGYGANGFAPTAFGPSF